MKTKSFVKARLCCECNKIIKTGVLSTDIKSRGLVWCPACFSRLKMSAEELEVD